MRHFSLRQVSENDAVRLYEWTERDPSAVLKCTCQQVRSMKTLPELSYAIGGQTLFLHHERPALRAEVYGMVVGVTAKEDQVHYEVDDGTSVLRIVETRKSLSRRTKSLADQAGAVAAASCGIPECYIMPPQPQASTSANRLDNPAPAAFLPSMAPRFKVADIIGCAGKIQIDRGGQRYLLADRMALCDDINMESYHQRDVIKSEIELYRRPFDWNMVELAKTEPAARQSASRRLLRKPLLRVLRSDVSPDANSVTAPAMHDDAEPKMDRSHRRRLPEELARKLLSGGTAYPSPPESSSMSSPSLPRSSEPSILSRSSESNPRQLRAPTKVPDRNLTESYFQLQIQQHISQHYRSQPFSVSDLRSDSVLSTLAQRLVRIRLQHRLASRSNGAMHSINSGTSEQQLDKIHRLFEWAVRKMMQDGFVTLADANCSERSGTFRHSNDGSCETYRLVTPEYLLRPLQTLLGNKTFMSPDDAAIQDVEQLATRLRILDDRFRNVDRCLVQDSLALYRARCTPIVID
ncbi:hypothetical protein PHSY_003972 [Pseudozyma hubeiensis SY62]|uniref:CST complex subunit STN1 n=1 Tax=Pseudozyma hubeiensis (strain SY62) TaxID=1305764 RepID=R9P5A0_PSEHS|nr:hypothetical protein PHSY_003972 [Pseudozyma hubeiensis SY62]GAC96392.1 hypothetical protein PHSY_003972 [Pseudozyma hubeiensis SY62]